MSAVLFPAFTQVQGEPDRLRRGYLTMTALTAMLAASAMGTLAVVAPHLILALYGPAWTGVVGAAAGPLRRGGGTSARSTTLAASSCRAWDGCTASCGVRPSMPRSWLAAR